jgi:geranylgeranyl pyrophosphate synthase
LEATDALDYAWRRAEEQVGMALSSLDCLADTPAKDVLRDLAHYVVHRTS